MTNRQLNISDWRQPESVSAVPIASSSNRSWARVLGVVGTLLVHTVVLQTVLLGSRKPKMRPPEVQGPGATLIKSEADPTEPLVLIQLSNVDERDKLLLEDLASTGSAPKPQLVTMISSDPLPHVEIPLDAIGDNNDAVASTDSGDPAARAALFGLYTGQIDARIERAWQRPRSPVKPNDEPQHHLALHTDIENDADTFKCQVRILQDHHGGVQEVQLLECNGSIEWQQSLVRAIFSSSPLPAPPSTTVFTHSLTMTFEGHTYTSSSSSDEYEPVRNQAERLVHR